MIKYILLITVLISTQANAEMNIVEILEPIGRPGATLATYIAEDFTSYMARQNNYQVETKSYDYDSQQITFQHQSWKIQEASICSNYPKNTPAKSQCQIKAKKLFNMACNYLTEKRDKTSIQEREQRMYCNAGTSFNPQIIRISKAKAPTEIEKARSECNALILEAMGNNDPRIAGRKKEACNSYKELKENKQMY